MPKSKSRVRRVTTVNATRRVLEPIKTSRSGRRDFLGADRRLFTPPGVRTLRNARRLVRTVVAVSRLASSKKKSRDLGRERLRVLFPTFAPLCSRRKTRRRVLHARGVAGRRGLRHPVRTALSAVYCKR